MNEISNSIKRLKRLLNKYIDTQFLSIDDQESLLQVCLACSDTNDFIKYAEIESQNNVDGFPITISSLKTDVDEMIELLNTHESGFFSEWFCVNLGDAIVVKIYYNPLIIR